jgi:hypothetical protein
MSDHAETNASSFSCQSIFATHCNLQIQEDLTRIAWAEVPPGALPGPGDWSVAIVMRTVTAIELMQNLHRAAEQLQGMIEAQRAKQEGRVQ